MLYILLCGYHDGGTPHRQRFWGRLYPSRQAAEADYASIPSSDSGREAYFYSHERRVLIEKDLGETMLPSCIV